MCGENAVITMELEGMKIMEAYFLAIYFMRLGEYFTKTYIQYLAWRLILCQIIELVGLRFYRVQVMVKIFLDFPIICIVLFGCIK